MKSVSRSEQHIFFNTDTSVHHLSLMLKHIMPPHDLNVDSASRSDLISWKFGRWSALSGMVPFSHVYVKHRAAEFEKFLFNRESRRSLSVLLGREWRFARWMLGNGVLWQSFTRAPARFSRLRVLNRLNSTAAPPTKMSSKNVPPSVFCVCSTCICTCMGLCRMSGWDCKVKSPEWVRALLKHVAYLLAEIRLICPLLANIKFRTGAD